MRYEKSLCHDDILASIEFQRAAIKAQQAFRTIWRRFGHYTARIFPLPFRNYVGLHQKYTLLAIKFLLKQDVKALKGVI